MTALATLSNISRSKGDPKVLRSGPSSLRPSDRLARGLGWFSIGLGLTELAAPQAITRALGMEGRETLVRAYGAREIASGILSLSIDKQVGLWSRVAGDGLDIVTVMGGLRADNSKRANVAVALAVLAGVTLVDVYAAQVTATGHSRGRGQRRLYQDRSGFPRGSQAARGAARDFVTPPDMRAAPVIASIFDRATATGGASEPVVPRSDTTPSSRKAAHPST